MAWVALVIVAVTSPVWGCHSYNDLLMAKLERQCFEAPLPPDTSLLDQSSSFGNLYGTSNQCNARLRLYLVSLLSLEEIRKHYTGLGLRPVFESKSAKLDIRVKDLGRYPETPELVPEENGLLVPRPDGGRFPHLYIVEFDDGGDAGWDMRCN